MTFPREPRILPVSINALRPTQITVGMREVRTKRKSWRDHPDRKKAVFLGRHVIPVVWVPTPFSEFLRADFLRRQIKLKSLEDDFSAALVQALKLAKSGEADYLPGWCGPIA